MKNKKQLSLSEQIEMLELANKALRNYATRLEEKVAKYEGIMRHCPRFQVEKRNAENHHADVYDEFYEDPSAEDFDEDFDEDFEDDWDGLEESDFIDDWEDDDFDEEDFSEDD